jgi:hypothetical protein
MIEGPKMVKIFINISLKVFNLFLNIIITKKYGAKSTICSQIKQTIGNNNNTNLFKFLGAELTEPKKIVPKKNIKRIISFLPKASISATRVN